jgi:glycosyltransferase involved in cell wall biosynthesis
MSVAVMLPTYNEAENIESLIRKIEALNLNATIVVVDDSSPDGTAEIARKLNGEYGNIHVVLRPDKLGLGMAITAGFRYLLKLRNAPEYVITMDADYSHNPKDVPRLLEVAKDGCDLVIGSRYIEQGKVLGSSLRRRLVSRLANIVAGVTIGTKLHDCTSGFRCYSQRYVKSVLPALHSQTYEIQIETVKQARLNGFRIKEIPITFVNRKRGKSKLTATESQAFISYIFKTTFGKFLTFDLNWFSSTRKAFSARAKEQL